MSLTYAGNRHRLHRWRMAGNGVGSNDMWIRPTDIPADEADELRKLYNLTSGDNWTDNTNWGRTPVANDWFGITVSGGKVTQIRLYTNNLVGTITSFDPSVFTALTTLHLYGNASLSGVITNWTIPSTTSNLILNLTGLSGDLSGWALSAGIQYFYVSGTSVNGVPDLSSMVAIREIRVQDCALSQAHVDLWGQRLYTRWFTGALTWATPDINIGGTNATPGGTYQDGDPPTTGLEYLYEINHDPESTGYNTWTATWNGGSGP